MKHAQIIGRLLNNPECSYTSGEKPLAICKIMVNVEKQYEKDQPQNIPVTLFGKRAESFASMAQKGAKIFLECSIAVRERPNQRGGSFYNIELYGQNWLIQPDLGNFSVREREPPQKGQRLETDVPDLFDPSSVPF